MKRRMPQEPATSDVETFTRLVQDLIGALRSYVAARVGPDDVQDVLAQVLLIVWRRWSDLPSPAEDRRKWVFGIARMTVRSTHGRRLRHRRLLERLTQHEPAQSSPSPEETVLAGAETDSLLQTLPTEQRIVVRAAVINGIPLAELADQLDISMSALTSRLHRARVRLRAELQRREGQ